MNLIYIVTAIWGRIYSVLLLHIPCEELVHYYTTQSKYVKISNKSQVGSIHRVKQPQELLQFSEFKNFAFPC